MTPARLAFYCTVLFGAVLVIVMGAAILILFLAPHDLIGRSVFTFGSVGAALVAYVFALAWLLRYQASRNQIGFVDPNGRPKAVTNGMAAGFLWGSLWRSTITGLVAQAGAALLKQAYGPYLNPEVTGTIAFASSSVSLFLAFWWVYASSFGSSRVVFGKSVQEVSARVDTDYPAAAPVSLMERLQGVLGVAYPLMYFVIGLVQLSAVYAYFRDVLGWWVLPSLIGGGIIGYIPLVGALAGGYAAIHAWGWPLWSAVVLFGFPFIVLGIMMLGVGASAAAQSVFGRFRR